MVIKISCITKWYGFIHSHTTMFVAHLLLMLVKSFNNEVQLTKLKAAITHKLHMVMCTKSFGKLVVETHENALAILEQMKLTSSINAKHLGFVVKCKPKVHSLILNRKQG